MEEKKGKVGRPRKGEEKVQDPGTREVVKQLRSVGRRLKGIEGLVQGVGEGGGDSQIKRMEVAEYFLPVSSYPGAVAIENEVNRLINLYPEKGWLPVYVTSEPSTLDAGGGVVQGRTLMILWGHS